MNEILSMVLALMGGGVLGALFFYGLWVTVKRSVATKIPALWFLGSTVLRTVIILAGFYFVSKGNLQRLLVCLLGFVLARYIVKRLVFQQKNDQLQVGKGGIHES